MFIFLTVLVCINAEKLIGESFVNLSKSSSVKGLLYKVDETNVNAFLGIPFGKAPVKYLRFAPPEPVDPWQGELEAMKLPKTCWHYQFSGFDQANSAARIWANNTEMDEDCLYLNVWAPAKISTGKKLPVMVWIFGGGFFSGTATLDVYSGLFLAARQEVVVVSMQYRLGAFGFLYLPEGQVGGNMGILDQQLALKWVKRNIEHFGGNPELVTLFGESAGAASISLHYIAPSSSKLFRRMILQSSSVLNRWAISSPQSAHERSSAFTKACNCKQQKFNSKEEVDCLRKLNPQQIVSKLDAISNALTERRNQRLQELELPVEPTDFLTSAGQYFDVALRPVIDGILIPDCPLELINQQSMQSSPELLIGSMQNEGMYWLFYGLGIKEIDFLHPNGNITLPSVDKFQNAGVDIYSLITAKFVRTEYLKHPFPALITSQYKFNSPGIQKVTNFNTGVKNNKITDSLEFMTQIDNLTGEIDFICGTLEFAKRIARKPGAKVHYYNFDYKKKDNGMPDWVGAMHGYEIEFVFGMPYSTEFQEKFYKFSEEERNLSDKLMRYWANFARTGDTNIKSDKTLEEFDWPAFDAKDERYAVLGMRLSTGEHLREIGCRFWNELFPSLIQIQLKKSDPQNVREKTYSTCPYIDQPLYKMEPLNKFVPGEYNGVYQLISTPSLLLVIVLLINMMP